jgi:hypothetical protein
VSGADDQDVARIGHWLFCASLPKCNVKIKIKIKIKIKRPHYRENALQRR